MATIAPIPEQRPGQLKRPVEPQRPTQGEQPFQIEQAQSGQQPQPQTPRPQAQPRQTQTRQLETYDDVYGMIEDRRRAIKPLDKEERERLKRRERTEAIISGVADAASAISNMVAVHHGAPNMYNLREGMSAKAQERFDKAKAMRDANDREYIQWALEQKKLRDADDDRAEAKEDRSWRRQLQQAQERRAQAEHEHKQRMQEIERQIKERNLSYAEAKALREQEEARYSKSKADHADEYFRANIKAKNRSGSGRSGGRQGQYTVKRRNLATGEVEYRGGFTSEAAARNFATTYAKDGWTYSTTPSVTTNKSTHTDRRGHTSTRETTSSRDVSTPKDEVSWD